MSDTNFEAAPTPEHGPFLEVVPKPSVIERQPSAPVQVSASSATSPAATLPRKDPQLLTIEGVLAEGMDQAYLSLTEAKRREFRSQGEQTARAIQDLLSHGKATVNKIRALIMKWLQLIPGVNRFFLEQEAKIKTDKILRS